MSINDIFSVFLLLFALYMGGSAIHTHDRGKAVIWIVIAVLNAFALYLSDRRRARNRAENEPVDVPYEDISDELEAEERRQDAELERLDEEDAQDEFDEEDL